MQLYLHLFSFSRHDEALEQAITNNALVGDLPQHLLCVFALDFFLVFLFVHRDLFATDAPQRGHDVREAAESAPLADPSDSTAAGPHRVHRGRRPNRFRGPLTLFLLTFHLCLYFLASVLCFFLCELSACRIICLPRLPISSRPWPSAIMLASLILLCSSARFFFLNLRCLFDRQSLLEATEARSGSNCATRRKRRRTGANSK